MKTNLFSFLTLYFFIFFPRFAFSSEKIYYFIDTQNIQQKSLPKTPNWKQMSLNNEINFGYQENSVIWLKIPKNAIKLHHFIYLDNIHLDSVTIYSEGKVNRLFGDRTKHNNLYLSGICFPIKKKVDYFLKIKKTSSFVDLRCKIETKNNLVFKHNLSFFLISLLIGGVSILLAYTLFLFFQTHKTIYILYGIYTFSTLMYCIISTGFAKFFLFSNFIYFSEARIYSAIVWFLSLLLFFQHFFQFKHYAKRLNNWINRLIVFILFLAISSLFFYYYDFQKIIKLMFFTLYFSFIVSIILIVFSIFRKTQKGIYKIYFILSFSPQFIWSIIFLLNALKLITFSPPIDLVIVFSIYEVLLFGVLLSLEYRNTFQENIFLLQKSLTEAQNRSALMIQIQQKERKDIAQEIHNVLANDVVHLNRLLERNEIAQSIKQTQILHQQIRKLSHQVLPSELEMGHFSQALEKQLNIINQTGGIHTELNKYDFPDQINEEWITSIYLVVLEFLQNSIRHGEASFIQVDLFGYPNAYVIQISDNGIGFDAKNKAKFGFGLKKSTEYVNYYGGEIHIDSSNEGTTVIIELKKIG